MIENAEFSRLVTGIGNKMRVATYLDQEKRCTADPSGDGWRVMGDPLSSDGLSGFNRATHNRMTGNPSPATHNRLGFHQFAKNRIHVDLQAAHSTYWYHTGLQHTCFG